MLFRPQESILTTGILGFAGGKINRLIIIIPEKKDRIKFAFQKGESFGTQRIDQTIVKIGRRAKK